MSSPIEGVEKIGERGGGIAIAPSAEIARLTLGMPSTGGGGVEARSAYSEQEHSGKTKATLDGILGTRSLLRLRRREYFDSPRHRQLLFQHP